MNPTRGERREERRRISWWRRGGGEGEKMTIRIRAGVFLLGGINWWLPPSRWRRRLVLNPWIDGLVPPRRWHIVGFEAGPVHLFLTWPV